MANGRTGFIVPPRRRGAMNRSQAAHRRTLARFHRGRGRPPCVRRWSTSRTRRARAHGQRSQPRAHQDRRRDRHDRVSRAISVFHDVDRPALGERPHRLSGVRKERRLAQQPLVPRPRGLEVPHAQTRKEVQRHPRDSRSRGDRDTLASPDGSFSLPGTLAASLHRSCPIQRRLTACSRHGSKHRHVRRAPKAGKSALAKAGLATRHERGGRRERAVAAQCGHSC